MKKKIAVGIYCVVFLVAAIFRAPLARAFEVMTDQNLKGTVIVIDAGHGGKDPGARVNGQDEDEINLDLALKLAELLEKAGATVEMTRREDVDLSDEGVSNVKQSDMKHRSEILNQKHVTLFVSLHCNTSQDQRCKGSQVYYRNNDIHSRNLADSIQNRLKTITSSRYLPVSGDFYLLNQTETLGVLVEVGFMSNSEDLSCLQDDSYRKDLVYGIYQGISDFLSIFI